MGFFKNEVLDIPQIAPSVDTPQNPVIYKDQSKVLQKSKMELNAPIFDFHIAARIIEAIANGISMKEILKQEKLTQFHLEIWKEAVPKFKRLLIKAKKCRAEFMTEEMIDLTKQLMTDAKITSDPKILNPLVKMVERVTSVHDPDQNLRSGAQVNIQNINQQGPNAPQRVEVKEVFKEKGGGADMLDKVRLDPDVSSQDIEERKGE